MNPIFDLGLAGQNAIVTGGSRGIGKAIVANLAGQGMNVISAARDEQALAQNAAQINTELARQAVYPFAEDLSLAEKCNALINYATTTLGQINLLVNCAGATKRGDFFDLSENDWTDGFGLKFYAAVRLTRAAWPLLRVTQGSVINVIGIGGRTAKAEFTIGGAVNAALMNFTKAMADRGIEEGVRVNAINPSTIITERLKKRIEKVAMDKKISISEAEANMVQLTGINRFGKPEEIANIVAFLASPQAAYLQGAIIDADGGQTRTL